MSEIYSHETAMERSLEYFGGDELAANVFITKYSLRNANGKLLELTPDDMHHRLAKEFARIERNKFKEPLTEEQIFEYFRGFQKICCHGSPMYGVGNNHQIVSLSNCYFLEKPLDNYNSILDIDKQLVNISKRRGGVGIDLSNLRPRGTRTNNAAHSSTGITSWMERYSHSIREVGQNNRRGALMLTLSVHHPDILDFSTIKNDLTKVTGANISIRLTNEFLDAVKNNTYYEQRFPVDSTSPTISTMVSAKLVWDTIINSAWLCAEPGLIMWDNVLKGPADCYEEYRSQGTNPCCFATDQTVWIITNNGYKELKTITKDDLVWCSYDHKWCKTSGYFQAGIHPVYKVVFENDSELYITQNHKLGKYDENTYVKNYKHYPILTELKDLKVGNFIYINDVDPIINLSMYSYVSCHYGDEEQWLQIKNIEYSGESQVGCIEVEDTHYFSANGIISGNSEITLSPLDSCRLMCINLFSFVKNPFTKNAKFDYDRLYEYAQITQRLMDDLVDLESEKIDGIIKKINDDPEPKEVKKPEKDMWLKIKKNNDEGRRTGTGITGLGDVLAAINVQYGSEESIVIVEKIYQTLKLGCYRSSVDMAKEIGHFTRWNPEVEKDCEFLLRIKEEDPKLYSDMNKYGRRNIALLTTAPAGSVSILTQTTSGIEPLFKLEPYTRRRKLTDNIKEKPDFVDKVGDKWKNYEVWHTKIQEWMNITGETDVKKSPWYKSCANDVDWENRIRIQSAAQKNVCHSISSTINLPNNTTKETIEQIYTQAFQSGCKGITIYRDGCRDGVLISKEKTERPRELQCDVHHITSKGQKFFVLVGKREDGSPYEVFSGLNNILDGAIKSGIIIKKKKNFYKAVFDNGDELSPISNSMSDVQESISRLCSLLLRNKVDMHKIIIQLERIGESRSDLQCFSACLARALKKYIPDGAREKEICECGGILVRVGGCPTCYGPNGIASAEGCGYSKCS